ncbi:uncharacterized protein MYCFIDRAFT_131738 [Pseudocercospora fijiensis CIRAD86]|uniref:Uncharacterized protein n=1 Tax=Pseudocercospora fijiensis (strain CIRAD86) TaxID=383855 RepID=M3A6Y8_PSEFD|nr:uncharacterized protein MYCFIDRAFT_131738 [Pseudocercospora fijiensis CIRAD86]EME86859.1 hypothetical protein MYCFIDRAFT_131738 [Pseudocercospora fijiensis CIRAD86]
MAPATKRRSTRQSASRKRSIYYEPDTDEDDFEASGRSEEDFAPDTEVVQEPVPKKRKVTRKRKPQTRSKAAARTKQTTLVRAFRIGKARRAQSAPVKKGFEGPSDGNIPNWKALPEEVLKQIFIYASLPVDEFSRDASANATWLLKTARSICRAFGLAALEALYQSPPMLNTYHPHQLLDLLQMPREERYINYNVKVHRLNMDVRTVAYAASGRPSLHLPQLVSQLPQLQHMEILHPRYYPPFRPVKVQKWTFSPTDLIKAFESCGTRLRTWRWSRDTIPRNDPIELYKTMSTAHESVVFAYLKRLVVTGFNVDDSFEPSTTETNAEGEAQQAPPPGLATSIAKLPSLVDLTFISCDTIMEKFLQRLPTNLERLELTNCLEITSEMMRDFFKTSGSHLKELVLNHNAALNLSFTTSLKELCPRLEVLKVDLHYYSEKDSVNDAEALYDELLPESDIPSWPSTLRHLEIIHAQKWSPEAAQNLFRSLVDNAPELLQLRTLIIHAHINIPWRDRAGFRDQWIERLGRVYLRRNGSPNENLGSIRQRAVAVQAPAYQSTGDTQRYSDSEVEHETPCKRQPRRSRRVAESQASVMDKTATPSPESDSESADRSEVEAWRRRAEKFIQGLCTAVDIRIDNQRPRENQWTEGDFMDDELSGDEDWNEDAEEEDDGYAW